MKIILMRHGKPLLPEMEWVAPAEMGRWLECYNRSEVAAFGIPTVCFDLVGSVSSIVTSTAPRALSSAQALGQIPSVIDAVFCEAELPFALWRFPRLPPNLWAAFFRLLWFFGYSRSSNSKRATQVRAVEAANKLLTLVESGSVLLIGHGVMNRLIAKELIARGWSGQKKHKNHYWSATAYELKTYTT